MWMTAVVNFFFVAVVPLMRAEVACRRLVSQYCSEAGYSPCVCSVAWCRDTVAFVCSAGLSSQVNYITSKLLSQSVYAASLFSPSCTSLFDNHPKSPFSILIQWDKQYSKCCVFFFFKPERWYIKYSCMPEEPSVLIWLGNCWKVNWQCLSH